MGLVAEMTGGMQRLLEITVEYAKTRKQFGRPIGQFQAVQHHMRRHAGVYREFPLGGLLRRLGDPGRRYPKRGLAVSVAKAYASDAYREVGNRAIQVHGGMGFHLGERRAPVSIAAPRRLKSRFGDATYHRERIARLVIDAGHVQQDEPALSAVHS